MTLTTARPGAGAVLGYQASRATDRDLWVMSRAPYVSDRLTSALGSAPTTTNSSVTSHAAHAVSARRREARSQTWSQMNGCGLWGTTPHESPDSVVNDRRESDACPSSRDPLCRVVCLQDDEGWRARLDAGTQER